jgi:hypothetical protein
MQVWLGRGPAGTGGSPGAYWRDAAATTGIVHVDVLTFKGCRNVEAATALVRELVDELGVEADLHETRVEGPEEAQRLRFLGSPTIRVDGRDVEPGASVRREYVLACRVYQTGQGAAGVPDREWVRDALLGLT